MQNIHAYPYRDKTFFHFVIPKRKQRKKNLLLLCFIFVLCISFTNCWILSLERTKYGLLCSVKEARIKKQCFSMMGAMLGHPHTEESKSKISAANRGKVPWNKGKKHSPETVAKIRQRTMEAMIRKRKELAAAKGLTLEQYEEFVQSQKQVQIRPPRSAPRQVPQEVRQKISEKMKALWQSMSRSESQERSIANLQRGFGNRTHSQETRERIAAKIRLNWQNPEYRAKISEKLHSSEETRKKISDTLKSLWKQEDFRQKQIGSLQNKSDLHRKNIAEAIRRKWKDPDYRAKLQKTYDTRSPNKPKAPSVRKNKPTSTSLAKKHSSTHLSKKRQTEAARQRQARLQQDDTDMQRFSELPQRTAPIAAGVRIRLSSTDYQMDNTLIHDELLEPPMSSKKKTHFNALENDDADEWLMDLNAEDVDDETVEPPSISKLKRWRYKLPDSETRELHSDRSKQENSDDDDSDFQLNSKKRKWKSNTAENETHEQRLERLKQEDSDLWKAIYADD